MHKHYSLLGLQNGADREAIKNAFRRLAMVFHPDRDAESGRRFNEICQAYEALMKHVKTNHCLSLNGSSYTSKVRFNHAKTQNRRLGKRGSPGDRRFESVMEHEYKGVHVKHLV